MLINLTLHEHNPNTNVTSEVATSQINSMEGEFILSKEFWDIMEPGLRSNLSYTITHSGKKP